MTRHRNYDHIDGRDLRAVGKPGEHHVYARTPNLAQIRQAAGITDAMAEPLLKEQGYGLGTLHALENGATMNRLTISRVTACLGLSHAQAKEGFE